METTTEPIVVEETYRAPPAAVWKAITDQDQMRQWYFEPIEEFKPETGFETQFNVHVENRNFLHVWNITEVVPEKRIAYGWRCEGFPGNSTVVWELTTTPDGTKLSLTHDIQEPFPQDDPLRDARRSTRGR